MNRPQPASRARPIAGGTPAKTVGDTRIPRLGWGGTGGALASATGPTPRTTESDLPVAYIVALAKDNEKKHAPSLLDKTVEATKGRVRTVVADPQYSSGMFREKAADYGVEAVIPYPRNQRRGARANKWVKDF